MGISELDAMIQKSGDKLALELLPTTAYGDTSLLPPGWVVQMTNIDQDGDGIQDLSYVELATQTAHRTLPTHVLAAAAAAEHIVVRWNPEVGRVEEWDVFRKSWVKVKKPSRKLSGKKTYAENVLTALRSGLGHDVVLELPSASEADLAPLMPALLVALDADMIKPWQGVYGTLQHTGNNTFAVDVFQTSTQIRQSGELSANVPLQRIRPKISDADYAEISATLEDMFDQLWKPGDRVYVCGAVDIAVVANVDDVFDGFGDDEPSDSNEGNEIGNAGEDFGFGFSEDGDSGADNSFGFDTNELNEDGGNAAFSFGSTNTAGATGAGQSHVSFQTSAPKAYPAAPNQRPQTTGTVLRVRPNKTVEVEMDPAFQVVGAGAKRGPIVSVPASRLMPAIAPPPPIGTFREDAERKLAAASASGSAKGIVPNSVRSVCVPHSSVKLTCGPVVRCHRPTKVMVRPPPNQPGGQLEVDGNEFGRGRVGTVQVSSTTGSQAAYNVILDNTTTAPASFPINPATLPYLQYERPADKYSRGTHLAVAQATVAGDQWVDATVVERVAVSRYTLQSNSRTFTMDLNRGSHYVPYVSDVASLDNQIKSTMQELADLSATVVDGLSGQVLRIANQTVELDLEKISSTVRIAGLDDARNVRELSKVLVSSTISSRHGLQPMAMLVRAKAGSGKTWLTRQMVHLLAVGTQQAASSAFVPLLITMPALANLWRRELNKMGANRPPGARPDDKYDNDMLEWFLRTQYADDPSTAELYLDAYHSHRLVFILDGLDEAADLWMIVRKFVVDVLVAGGVRCMLTSRPEGLAAAEKEDPRIWDSVTVFDLKEYSAEQQREVLSKQLTGKPKEFVTGVLNFGEAVTEMDLMFNGIDDEVLKSRLVRVEEFDKTYRNQFSGEGPARIFDSQMCQRIRDPSSDGDSRPVKNWAEYTDVATVAKPLLDSKLAVVAAELGLQLELAPLKGQVRAEEKARDKYADVEDPTIADRHSRPDTTPISWVADGVRGTLKGKVAPLLGVKEALVAAGLDVVRTKNFFANLDPTHFRRIMYTVEIPLPDGTVHYGEVQIMTTEVYTFKKERKDLMHEPYEVFRTLFGLEIDSKLDSKAGWMSLTTRVAEWSSFVKEPVLMALLVAVLGSFDFENPKIDLLPNSRGSLYRSAIEDVIAVKLGIDASTSEFRSNPDFKDLQIALRTLAHANHFSGSEGRRNFSSADVKEVLLRDTKKTGAAGWELFEKCLNSDVATTDPLRPYRVPTVKEVDANLDPTTGDVVVTLQSVHISLQEFLCAERFVNDFEDEKQESGGINISTKDGISQLLTNPRHLVMLELAAGLGLGSVLFKALGAVLNLSRWGSSHLGVLATVLAHSQFDPPVKSIDLSNNEFDINGIKRVAMMMPLNRSIVTLDLAACGLTGSLDAAVIAELLADPLCALDSVNLSSNPLGDDGLRQISEGITINRSLSSLDLSSVQGGGDGVLAVGDALLKNTTLLVVNLVSNSGVQAFRARVTLAAAERSLSGRTALPNGDQKIFEVADTYIGGAGDNLELLDCSDANLTPDDFYWLGTWISEATQITTVNFSSNDLGKAEAAAAAVDAIRRCTAVRTLRMEDCKLGTSSTDAIGVYLGSTDCRLTTLAMSSNPLGNGAVAIADSIASNGTVHTLHLSECGLLPQAASAISAMLAGSSMRTIDLSSNPEMRNNGALEVANGAAAGELQHLDLAGVLEDGDGMVEVLGALKYSPVVRLDLAPSSTSSKMRVDSSSEFGFGARENSRKVCSNCGEEFLSSRNALSCLGCVGSNRPFRPGDRVEVRDGHDSWQAATVVRAHEGEEDRPYVRPDRWGDTDTAVYYDETRHISGGGGGGPSSSTVQLGPPTHPPIQPIQPLILP